MVDATFLPGRVFGYPPHCIFPRYFTQNQIPTYFIIIIITAATTYLPHGADWHLLAHEAGLASCLAIGFVVIVNAS